MTNSLGRLFEDPQNARSPRISVLITNYNYGRYLASAIDSVLNQLLLSLTPQDIQIVVIDDGSTDQSRAVLARYGDRITTLLKPNGGQDSALNAGFEYCQGEFVCLMDADDCFTPNKLETIVSCMTQHPDIGWCFHTLLLKDLRTNAAICKTRAFPGTVVDQSQRCDFRKQISLGSLPFYPSSTSGLCFRRSLLQCILPMPETFITSSADRYIRLAAIALAPGYFIAKPLTIQGIHGQNISTMRPDRPTIPERQIVIAYLLRTQFPTLSRFTNRIFSAGLTVYQSLRLGKIEPEYRAIIHEYWRLCSPLERIAITLMRLYRRRPWQQPAAPDYYTFFDRPFQSTHAQSTIPESVSTVRRRQRRP